MNEVAGSLAGGAFSGLLMVLLRELFAFLRQRREDVRGDRQVDIAADAGRLAELRAIIEELRDEIARLNTLVDLHRTGAAAAEQAKVAHEADCQRRLAEVHATSINLWTYIGDLERALASAGHPLPPRRGPHRPEGR